MNFKAGRLVPPLIGTALFAQTATAQDDAFTYEMEIEIGAESVLSSDDPTAELTDGFVTVDVGLEYALAPRTTAFAGFTLESQTDAVGDRAFEDLGLYVSELGLRFDLGSDAALSVGKISPAFGVAWDTAPGFFGTAFAEDYEIAETLGASLALPVGPGTLTASLFWFDDSVLSRSVGFDRGRNTTAAGGAGNTGKPNNLALQYDIDAGGTVYSLSGRYLSAGVGDARDETGLAFGVAHSLTGDVELMAEVAAFNGYGGTTDNANYVTVGASYANGPMSYSASYTRRNVSSVGTDNLLSVGLDYTFDNDVTMSSGLAFVEEGGVKSSSLGLSVIIPLGG